MDHWRFGMISRKLNRDLRSFGTLGLGEVLQELLRRKLGAGSESGGDGSQPANSSETDSRLSLHPLGRHR